MHCASFMPIVCHFVDWSSDCILVLTEAQIISLFPDLTIFSHLSNPACVKSLESREGSFALNTTIATFKDARSKLYTVHKIYFNWSTTSPVGLRTISHPLFSISAATCTANGDFTLTTKRSFIHQCIHAVILNLSDFYAQKRKFMRLVYF